MVFNFSLFPFSPAMVLAVVGRDWLCLISQGLINRTAVLLGHHYYHVGML